MTLRSRIPASARLSVRGIGVAESVSTSTARPQLLEPLLRRDPEPLLLVDHHEAEVPERHVLRQQPVGADHDVDRPGRPAPRPSPSCSFADTNRDSSFTVSGNAANRWLNVVKCCPASTVVGTRTATCLPSWVALNAARSATSVLP